MKKVVGLAFSMCFLFFVIPAKSQERSLDGVRDLACTFFSGAIHVPCDNQQISESYRENIQISPIMRNGLIYLYIINMPEGGWAIISNEQRYLSIIGYSTESVFDPNLNHQPGALRLLLEHHMNMIDSLRESPSTFFDRVSSHSPILHPIEEPQRAMDTILLYRDGHVNRWAQYGNASVDPECGKVYNKFCPAFFFIECERTYVGCTAVAIAQVLWYWRWPDFAMIHDTIDAAGVLYGDVHRHYYDWDNMLTSINNETPMYKVNMVAGLLRDCGYAANMIYSLTGSAAGTIKLANALEGTYDFHVNPRFEYAWMDFNPILQYELQQKRPVICQAQGSGIHTFVIDGYSAVSNKYHINWGWGQSESEIINSMWDLGFNGYSCTRTFFTELYPNCIVREASINDIEENVIENSQDVSLYSENNIRVDSLCVYNGGHLNISAGGVITLDKGFRAMLGSSVKLKINYNCSSNGADAPLTMTTPNGSSTKKTHQASCLSIVPNPVKNYLHIFANEPLKSILILNTNGQTVFQTQQIDVDVSHLSQGVYVIRAITMDGQILQSKMIHE